jgi:hypothetical protein
MIRDEVDSVINHVSSWDDITVEPHRFGGREFKLDNIEIGHIHTGGLVDIPFTRAIREQLVAEQRAQPHHVLPDSGWISFYMRNQGDLERALWLLKLSYLQKRINRSRKSPDELAALIAELDVLEPGAALRELIA